MISRMLLLPKKLSILLLGPRMTGKSTWLRDQFKNALFIDLLQESNFQRYLSDSDLFRKEVQHYLANHPKGVVIVDEIQRIPHLLNEVQSLMSHDELRFILSGSSARKLKRGDANLLAGRAIEKKFFPFVYSEIKDSFELENVLQYGSLPKVYLSEVEEKKLILRTYVSTYLREEIQAEGTVRSLPSFSKFLTLAAESCAQEVNFSEISRETTVSSKTIRDYFSILEDTLLGHFLLPWEKSVRKQLAGSPKFYFFDNGVLNALRENLSNPSSSDLKGVLFEQWIINEVRALLSYQEFEGSLYYWRTRGGAEVDLIIAKGSKPLAAIEIKSTQRPSTNHYRGLKSISEEYPEIKPILVCDCPRPINESGIEVLPYKVFLENLENRKLL